MKTTSKISRNRKKHFVKILPIRIDNSILDILEWVKSNDTQFISDSHFIRTGIFVTYMIRKELLEGESKYLDSDKINFFTELFNKPIRKSYPNR